MHELLINRSDFKNRYFNDFGIYKNISNKIASRLNVTVLACSNRFEGIEYELLSRSILEKNSGISAVQEFHQIFDLLMSFFISLCTIEKLYIAKHLGTLTETN